MQIISKPKPLKGGFWKFSFRDYPVKEVTTKNRLSFWILKHFILVHLPLNLEEAEIWRVNYEVDSNVVLFPNCIVLTGNLEIAIITYFDIQSVSYEVDYSNDRLSIIINHIENGEYQSFKYDNIFLCGRNLQFVEYLKQKLESKATYS